MNAPELLSTPLPFKPQEFQPGVSVDCVIFGFHDNQLKILLLETYYDKHWRLAGGLVAKKEDVDAAAISMLRARTGLTDIFLRQFHVFGDAKRTSRSQDILGSSETTPHTVNSAQKEWLLQRFVSVGYYALVDYATAQPRAGEFTKSCAWWELSKLPLLIFDHQQMIDSALESLRLRLLYEPIGYNLLPEKFTMPELQKLYEAILGRPLDRRNFQRRILSYGILQALGERRKGGAHKAPGLYSFDVAAYNNALKQGLKDGW